jgi:hypothetical protein
LLVKIKDRLNVVESGPFVRSKLDFTFQQCIPRIL